MVIHCNRTLHREYLYLERLFHIVNFRLKMWSKLS